MSKLSEKLELSINKTLSKYNHPHFLHEPKISKEEIKHVTSSLKSTFVSTAGGVYLKKFSKEISQLTNSKFVILTNSGTSALHISLEALGVNNDTEVLIPSFNYIASANSVLMCGGQPHFVESEKEYLGIDPYKLDKYLQKITKIKKNICINKKTNKRIIACIAVHVFGCPSNIHKLLRVLKKYKIFLIEDSAEGLGSYYKNKHVGTFGILGILSFNGNKIVTSGAGGAVITNNLKLSKKIDHLVSISKKKHPFHFIHDKLGYNYKMPNFNAALGYAQITQINKFLKSKKELFNSYKKNFENIDEVELFIPPKICNSNYWLIPIILKSKYRKKRDQVIRYLIKKGIHCRPSWKLLNSFEYLKNFQSMDLKISKDISDRIICLPSGVKYRIKK